MNAHPPEKPRDRLKVSWPLRAALCGCWAVSFLIGMVKVAQAMGRAPNRPPIFDFHAFIIAGRLTWEGRLADAYDAATMAGLQQQMGGQGAFMPWSYPPLFGLVMAPFSRMPIVPAYALFVLGAFALFLVALSRLAPRWAWLVLMTLAPSTIVNLATGQNGFLTGGLFALAAAAFSHRQAGQGGFAVGGLAYKPHMAVVWPILLAARGRWGTAAIAGAVALGLTGLSFAAVGPEPFKAMIAASADTSRYMAGGLYHLNRMTSLYACALSVGLPTGAALALHLVSALAVIGGLAWAGRRLPETALAGLAIMSTAFVSPYFYDYDLPLFGVGLAMVLPDLQARTTRLRLGLLLATIGAAQAVSLAVNFWPFRPSLGGPLLLAVFGVMLRLLAKAPAERDSIAPVEARVAA